ncbi:MAG: polyphosphate kinase 2 family protein [Chloroflexota bacterium]
MERYIVRLNEKIDLKHFDAGDTSAFSGDKTIAQKKLLKLNKELEALQELLYAEHKHKVLIVLQGMDTSGKDGTVRHVFEGVNPQGVRVASFKAPTIEELDHDYLWRIHQQIPAKGEIVIFNRSHYEDVLIVRVHNLAPHEIWKRRYEQISRFEHMLSEEGTIILKFYLHIDADEQKKRLQERLEDPTKHWKFSSSDLQERKLWDNYMDAYEDALIKTSSSWAPWYVVPANKKWYRNLVIASIIVDTLKNLNMKYPENLENLEGIKIE